MMPDTSGLGLPQFQNMWQLWMAGMGSFYMVVISIEVGLRFSEWYATRGTPNARRLFPENGIVNFLTRWGYDLTLALPGTIAMFGLSMLAYNASGWKIPLNWWTVPAYFLAGEFIHYFYHRLMHEVRLFWADHSVHHSATEFDYTTSLRFHLFEWIPKMITMPLLALLGFHPLLTALFGIFVAFQLFCHTARFGTWGSWDKFGMSPTNHGIHHSRNPVYMDRNYGGGTVLWDRIFGTYASYDGERMVYGITHEVKSTNLMVVYFNEYVYLWRDFFAAPDWKTKLQVLFGRPGETFEAPAQPASVKNDAVPAPAAAYGVAAE
jgi:sterol desaturase/sphingolipid hydroxylase (fatty acid hydroxylase superfamily)